MWPVEQKTLNSAPPWTDNPSLHNANDQRRPKKLNAPIFARILRASASLVRIRSTSNINNGLPRRLLFKLLLSVTMRRNMGERGLGISGEIIIGDLASHNSACMVSFSVTLNVLDLQKGKLLLQNVFPLINSSGSGDLPNRLSREDDSASQANE